MQTNLFITHANENNIFSQRHLDKNRSHFNGQCLKIYELLMNGEILTVYSAITKYGIHSLPRRIKDIKAKGVLINDIWDSGVTPKIKRWFINKENKETNHKKYNDF